VHEHEAYCQPCVSPIWDTALTCYSLLEGGGDQAVAQVRKGLEWMAPKQILDVKGDWIARRPDVRPGGWAFQYANPHYPDVDDTAVVVLAMDRAQSLDAQSDFRASIAVAREWILGMQSKNRALCCDAVPDRRDGAEERGCNTRNQLFAPHADGRRKLVWPLGHELHLRH